MPACPRAPCSFNRTSMELKLAGATYNENVSDPFNRTSMELKPMHDDFHDVTERPAFNRTSMELKPCQ